MAQLQTQSLFPQLGHDLDGLNRIPTHGEEVVADPHRSPAEDILPRPDQHFLFRRARLGARFYLPDLDLGRGQGPAVNLAMGGEWHARQPHKMSRHHVIGQHAGQMRPQGLGAGARHYVGHQLTGASVKSPGQHQGFGHPCVVQKALLDLS